MSTVPQQRKGSRPRQRVCTGGGKFETRAAAKAYIQKLKDKGQRGTANLESYPCRGNCSGRGKTIFHVGHRRKEINA